MRADPDLSEFLVAGGRVADDPVRRTFADVTSTDREEAARADAVIFGVPFDLGTQHHVGTYLGPMGVRRAFTLFRPYSVELGIDFSEHVRVADLGNIAVDDYKTYEDTFARIEAVVDWITEREKVPVMIGGDDSITYPAVKAFARAHERIGIIWIDAHFDCAESFRGDTLFCGCPLRNLLTETEGAVQPENVVHIGSRAYANYLITSSNARELGFCIRTAEDVAELGPRRIIEDALERVRDGTDAFWVAFDVDSLDVVYAPGTQSPRPGGLTSRELLTIVREASVAGAGGMSVVEVAPPIDIGERTSMVAAAAIMELIGGLAARRIPEFSRPTSGCPPITTPGDTAP